MPIKMILRLILLTVSTRFAVTSRTTWSQETKVFRASEKFRGSAGQFLRNTQDTSREAQRSPEREGFPLPTVSADRDTVGPPAAWLAPPNAIARCGLSCERRSLLISLLLLRSYSNSCLCFLLRTLRSLVLHLWWKVLKELVN